MFYDNYVGLCAKKRKSPSGVAKEIGLSNAAASRWRGGQTPSAVTLKKLSDYFGVPVSELLQEKENPPQEWSGRMPPKEYESLSDDSRKIVDDLIRSLAVQQQAKE